MLKITLIAVAALFLSITFVLLLIWRSAEGREDEKGFHPGSDGKLPDAQASTGSKVEQQDVAVPNASAAPVAAKR
ncbi:MAG TPA: hypothetical protein VNW23_01980 [Opitutaceae bacterium]|nr:hypothetical protein [Opitutaceae bacterium]